ncbi:MAG: hypothetical protein AAF720_10810 [Pseudomonadota bacterium]
MDLINLSAMSRNCPTTSRSISLLERLADKCDRLSAKEARPNKDLERRSDSIGTQKALEMKRLW